jgi:hypothetical protein
MVTFCNYNQFASPNGTAYVLNRIRAKYGSNVSTLADILVLPGEKKKNVLREQDFKTFLYMMSLETSARGFNKALKKS